MAVVGCRQSREGLSNLRDHPVSSDDISDLNALFSDTLHLGGGGGLGGGGLGGSGLQAAGLYS